MPRSASRWTVLVVLCLAVFVVNVSTTIVNIALPSIVEELGADTKELLWVVDAYNLAFAALVLAGGSLSDRFGRRGALLLGLAVFVVASFGGATAGDPAVLIAWRALAGIAAALVFPVTLSILSNVFPDRRERVKAIGIWGAATGMAVALGPVVGGGLIELFAWNAALVFNGAVALAALVLAYVLAPDSRDPETPPLDRSGLLLSTVALGVLVHTIIQGPERGWGSPTSLVAFALAGVLLAAFVVRERYATHPMLDVRLFANLRFSAASGAVTVAFFALFGFIFLVTQYFQFIRSYGPFEAGVRTLPVALAIAATSVTGTRLAYRVGTKLVVAGGLLSFSVAFLWITQIADDTSYWQIAGQMVLLGTGVGLTSTPATEAIIGVVPAAKAGIGSAVNDATRELGGTLGVAVIGSVALSVYQDRLGGLPGLPPAAAEPARESVGTALEVASRLAEGGGQAAAQRLTSVASSGFIDGLATGCFVAAAVTGLGALAVLLLLPAHPERSAA